MIYISVESRKGGVGKTTTALMLAEALVEKGYEVLVVDLDIIGTRIDESFLSANKEKIHEVKRNGKPVNLLNLFKNDLMVGKNLPAFTDTDSENENYMTIEKGKCNLVGSNIYEEKEAKEGENGEKKKKQSLLEDPRLLYDSFHAYWLLTMVKQIAAQFKNTIGHDKIALILDNSPGYSSTEKVVNDFLTDLGPEKGKIMLVSTIDPQDIAACRQTKMMIENLQKEKSAAGRYYRAMVENKKAERIESEAFDTVWNSLCASGGKDPEYYSEDRDVQKPFTGIIVNKVPNSINEQLYAKKILNRDDEFAAPFQNHLLYYFSNPKLSANEIDHTIRIERFNDFKLSGKIETIVEDEERYQKLRTYVGGLGFSEFFSQEWSPMRPFDRLISHMKENDALKSDGRKILDIKGYSPSVNGDKLRYEVGVVKKFVFANAKMSTDFAKNIDTIATKIEEIIRRSEGQREIIFDIESAKLEHLNQFVMLLGIAVYRLHSYETGCIIINELIKECLENAEMMETLDMDVVSNKIMDVVEGRCINMNPGEILAEILRNHKNGHRLRMTVETLMNHWKLEA